MGDVSRESSYPFPVAEHGAVTGRLRRVAQFDASIVRRAATINGPTQIGLTGIDYLDHRNFGAGTYADLTDSAKEFIASLESNLNVRVTLIGTGPGLGNIIDRR